MAELTWEVFHQQVEACAEEILNIIAHAAD